MTQTPKKYLHIKMEDRYSYLSGIPLDLILLISHELTIDHIFKLASIYSRNPKSLKSFFDALYQYRFKKDPPMNSQEWFEARLAEYQSGLTDEQRRGYFLFKMIDSDMIHEFSSLFGLEFPTMGLPLYRWLFEKAVKQQNLEILKIIIENHIPFNVYIYTGSIDQLIMRKNIEIIKYLLSVYGKVVPGQYYMGCLPLAARQGLREVVSEMMNLYKPVDDGNINIEFLITFSNKYDEYTTEFPPEVYARAAGEAAWGGHQDLVDYFLSLEKYDTRTYVEIMLSAARGGHFDVFQNIIGKYSSEFTVNDYSRALIFAAEAGSLKIVNYLLRNYGDTFSKDIYSEAIVAAVNRENMEIIKMLFSQMKNQFTEDDRVKILKSTMYQPYVIFKFIYDMMDRSLSFDSYYKLLLESVRTNNKEILKFILDIIGNQLVSADYLKIISEIMIEDDDDIDILEMIVDFAGKKIGKEGYYQAFSYAIDYNSPSLVKILLGLDMKLDNQSTIGVTSDDRFAASTEIDQIRDQYKNFIKRKNINLNNERDFYYLMIEKAKDLDDYQKDYEDINRTEIIDLIEKYIS